VNEIDQFTALRTWLLNITGLPEIIRAHPDAPRPQGAYGLLNLTRAERINWPDDLTVEEDDEAGSDDFPAIETPVETWESSWSFNAYGPGGVEALARTTSAVRSAAALLQLHPLVLHRTSGIRRLPELIETVWEDRAQVDLFVHYRVRHGFGADLSDAIEPVFQG
jgi:hypothetical protein